MNQGESMDHADLLTTTLRARDLEVGQVGENRWMTMLVGEWKRTIPVMFHLDEFNLKVSSLFCGRPDEGHAEVYELLLHKNERVGWVHFALDDEGDVVLVGQIPRDVLDEESLDAALGQILVISDEAFNAVLRRGFSTYLAAEQRWREKNDLPPNPVGDPKVM